MGIFDLVLIASVLLSLATWLVTAVVAATGRFRVAGKILSAWTAYVALYLMVVMIVSLTRGQRELAVGENVCFDDWCIAVAHIEHLPINTNVTRYRIQFLLSSRAKGIRQRERNITVYLLDPRGQRIDARLPDSEPPFDVLLSARESLRTSREFDVPTAATATNASAPPFRLVITHEGGFPIGWFIIGQGPFFQGIQLAIPGR